MLGAIKAKKYVFTNAHDTHAANCLRRLGVEDCFDGQVDVFVMNYKVKPQPESYEVMQRVAGGVPFHRMVFLDDRAANLAPAKKLGMTTVLVRTLCWFFWGVGAEAYALRMLGSVCEWCGG